MKQSTHLIPFPQFRQSTEWSCGATALQMVLAYYGIDSREGRLRAQAGTTPKRGTTVAGMQRVVREHGLRFTAKQQMTASDVQQYIRKKIPVILVLQAWTKKKNVNWRNDWNDGHYVIAIGYNARYIIFADPASIHRTVLTYSELEQRWHAIDTGKPTYDHFGIVVYGKKSRYTPTTTIHMD